MGRPLNLITQTLLCVILVLLPTVGGGATVQPREAVRRPVWVGKFYPDDGEALLRTIEQFTRQARGQMTSLPSSMIVKALILPHAGYDYSGLIAAYADHVLKNFDVDKVILLGPDHWVGFENGAISAAAWWATPLGKVPLHPDARRLLQTNPLFRYVADSDNREHSLEVLLPFLQVYLGAFKLLPIVLGPCDHGQMARTVDPLLGDKTLVVVSADLSHYLPYDQAVQRDKETIQSILDLNARPVLSDENRSCGKHPIAVLLCLARTHKWKPVLLKYANSGDTAGDRRRVVGYAAIAFYGEKSMSLSDQIPSRLTQLQGHVLVALARQTLMAKFSRKISQEEKEKLEAQLQSEALQVPCGTFVTLKIGGQLRGCIGSLVGRKPLAEDVRSNALNAAFHDPRFRPLTNGELDRVTIEVSVLTEPKPLAYDDAGDLIAKLRPRIDGVTIRKGLAGATFLPQVWEQLPDAETFLSHLCTKAGIPSDAWRQGDLEVETYQVQYFEEYH